MQVITEVFEIGGHKYNCIKLPPGEFLMGSETGLPIELPVHKVAIDRSITVLETPVTQQLYFDVTNVNPSLYINPNSPVENVSWYDAVQFCEKLSSMIGAIVRLPTESEWEYFCRAGTQTEYYFGDNERLAADYAWFNRNSMDETKVVMQKLPNPWGLYDVIGNVWEWTMDDYRSSYQADEFISAKKVIRGGAYDMDTFRLRSAYRSSEFPELSLSKIGFRVIIE